MNTPKGLQTDHISGDTLDTRKLNMRICTVKENGKNRSLCVQNKSGAKGVYWDNHMPTPKWRANIKKNDKTYHLGYYDNFDDAVEARKQAEIRFQGEFSRDYGNIESDLSFYDKNGERINKRKMNTSKIACNHCVYWNKNNDKVCEITLKQKGYWNKCNNFLRKEGY